MPLFRFHKGSLEESLKTTIIVKDFNELKKIIVEAMKHWMFINEENPEIELKINPYPLEDNFDTRIGWYTHMVTARYEKTTAHPIGFLSEPLQNHCGYKECLVYIYPHWHIDEYTIRFTDPNIEAKKDELA